LKCRINYCLYQYELMYLANILKVEVNVKNIPNKKNGLHLNQYPMIENDKLDLLI
jgi:hypothetical protein